jgi:hypothetical protein
MYSRYASPHFAIADDIAELARAFMDKVCRRMSKKLAPLSESTLAHIGNLIRAAGEPYNQHEDGTRPNIDAERKRLTVMSAEETARARQDFARFHGSCGGGESAGLRRGGVTQCQSSSWRPALSLVDEDQSLVCVDWVGRLVVQVRME